MMDSNAQDLLDALESVEKYTRSLAREARGEGYSEAGDMDLRVVEMTDKLDALGPPQTWSGDLAGHLERVTTVEATLARTRKVLLGGGESGEALAQAVSAIDQAIEVMGILSGGAESDRGRSK